MDEIKALYLVLSFSQLRQWYEIIEIINRTYPSNTDSLNPLRILGMGFFQQKLACAGKARHSIEKSGKEKETNTGIRFVTDLFASYFDLPLHHRNNNATI